MKKLLLLLASGSIAFTGSAQYRTYNMRAALDGAQLNYSSVREAKAEKHGSAFAHKTTAAGRWYDYADYLDANETALSSSVSNSFPYMWKNNNVLMTFSGPTYDTNNLVSYGMVLDPSYGNSDNGFNDYDYYPGEMKVTSVDNYVVDSIAIAGAYVDNPSQTGVDTIRVSLVHGSGATGADVYTQSTTITSGSVLTNYGSVGSSLLNHRMNFNAGTLTASGTTMVSYDILINNSATPPSWTADTASNGLYVKTLAVGGASGIAVSAGQMVGATVSHLSSAAVTPFDTVFLGSPANPPVKANMFRPLVWYRGTSTAAAFPTYLAADRNNGTFVDKLTTSFYVPHWFWSSGTSAATVQYPDIAFHITCTTCGTVQPPTDVKNIAGKMVTKVYPNPASEEVNVSFVLGNSANATVTLSNVMGQVVAAKEMQNVKMGTASFNTASLPSGMYIYTIDAAGQRTTGRVSVTH